MTRFLVLCTIVAISSAAFAQYPGGTGSGTGTMGTPTYTPRSYSSKGPIIGGVVAGGAALTGFLIYRHHRRATLVGCVGSDGNSLANENDKRTYTLQSSSLTFKPEERLEIQGREFKKDGAPVVQVSRVRKDLGSCKAIAEAR